MFEANTKGVALLLPSKGRFFDLFLTLLFVPTRAPAGYACKFFVCANYSKFELKILRLLFGRKANFIDERGLPWKGMVGAYNYAFDYASKMNTTWVALWADDLLPAKRNWLAQLLPIIDNDSFQMGIFSSDEGYHPGYFGWNIEAGSPCAHFYIARIEALSDSVVPSAFVILTNLTWLI
jgi:hypothetical protein